MAHLLFVFVIVFHTRSQSMPRWTSSACPSPLSALRTGIADCTITQNFTLFFDQRQPLHSNISKSSLPLGGHIARSGGKLIVFFFSCLLFRDFIFGYRSGFALLFFQHPIDTAWHAAIPQCKAQPHHTQQRVIWTKLSKIKVEKLCLKTIILQLCL